jgi:MoaA/NifB/PqqE/SkfB family radical SAM enzyme
MSYDDVSFVLDVLAKNHFSVAYFTGGETSLYPYLTQALRYAKKKGFLTSITTNGTMPKAILAQLHKILDCLSVSVDHYNGQVWDHAKSLPGVAKRAEETIRLAKGYGMNPYAVTFLNPQWSIDEVEKVVRYVNDELDVPFAFSYPFISRNNGTYSVGGKLNDDKDYLFNTKRQVLKVLEMKLKGAKVSTATGYLREILRAHDNLPLKYPCKAGRTILSIDCNLDVYPCYKKDKLFNLRDSQNLNLAPVDSSLCDNKECMINCFKEASEASRPTAFKASVEELVSNPMFYLGLIH